MATGTPQYFTMKGDFFIKAYGTAEAPHYVGNVPASTFSMTRETATLTSSGNESGDLAVEEVSKSASLSVTLNSLTAKNLAMHLYGTVQAQAAATAQAFSLPISKAGDMFKLAHVKVSNVELGDLEVGVDYKVLPKGGAIVLLKDTIAATPGTYDAGEASAIGVFTHSGKEYTLTFISENSGKTIVIHKWKPNPAAAFELISSEFAAPVLEGPVLIDESLTEGPLGRFGVIYDAN
jgi:hypothetical protein